MKLLRDLDVTGKKVFLRGDLDVPAKQLTVSSSQFTEVTRLTNLKLTIDYLLEHGASQITIAGHIGRPNELPIIKNPGVPFYVPNLSTKQLVEPLAKILGREVIFAQDFGHVTDAKVALFENLRFWSGEVGNDQVFANKLAILGQVYVNEAFGNCHREHASMVKLPGMLPHAAGVHLQREVEELGVLMANPRKPYVAVIGGAKIETKIPLITSLAQKADSILVGGLLCGELRLTGYKYPMPPNVDVGTLTEDGEDMESQSISRFVDVIRGAKTIIWNGPLGHFEEGHTKGSDAVAKAIIESGAKSVVGGGETTEFLAKCNLLSKFSFVSSGGGAMLEFLAGKKMPGIEALE